MTRLLCLSLGFVAFICCAVAPQAGREIADTNLATFFAAETAKLSQQSLTDVRTAKDWEESAPKLREQLAEMLGLQPLPPRSDLHPVITGRIEHEEFTVENLHFQSLPHLYVTANLYVPKNLKT